MASLAAVLLHREFCRKGGGVWSAYFKALFDYRLVDVIRKHTTSSGYHRLSNDRLRRVEELRRTRPELGFEEVLERAGITRPQYEEARHREILQNNLSLSQPTSESGAENRLLEEEIASDSDVITDVIRLEERAGLQAALRTCIRVGWFSERDRYVLQEILRGTTYKKIGQALGVTESRVTQVYQEVIRKVRRAVAVNRLKGPFPPPPEEDVTEIDTVETEEVGETPKGPPSQPCVRHPDRESSYGGKFCSSCRSAVWQLLKATAKKGEWEDLTKTQQAWFRLGPEAFETHAKAAPIYAEAFRLGRDQLTSPAWQTLFDSLFGRGGRLQPQKVLAPPVVAPPPEEPENVFPLRTHPTPAPPPEPAIEPEGSAYESLRREVAQLRDQLELRRAEESEAFRAEFPRDVKELLTSGKVVRLPEGAVDSLARELEGLWGQIYEELSGTKGTEG